MTARCSATIDASLSSAIALADTAATTVTGIASAAETQQLVIVATNSNTTIQHNTGIRLAGGTNFAMSTGTTLSLICVGGTWYETGRKST